VVILVLPYANDSLLPNSNRLQLRRLLLCGNSTLNKLPSNSKCNSHNTQVSRASTAMSPPTLVVALPVLAEVVAIVAVVEAAKVKEFDESPKEVLVNIGRRLLCRRRLFRCVLFSS
jgi:hypothetical protein